MYVLFIWLESLFLCVCDFNMVAGISNSVAKQKQEQSQKEIGTLSMNMKFPRRTIHPYQKGIQRKEVSEQNQNQKRKFNLKCQNVFFQAD